MKHAMRRRWRLAAMLLAGLIALALTSERAAARDDVVGWRGVRWGMAVEEALRQFDEARVMQQTKLELGGCYFRYGVPLELFDAAWEARLCEARERPVVIGVYIETRSYRDDFERIVAALTGVYGRPHVLWRHCFNAVGHETAQYRWFFASTTVTLVILDRLQGWATVRYEKPIERPDFGPGVCLEPPLDLRPDNAAPAAPAA